MLAYFPSENNFIYFSSSLSLLPFLCSSSPHCCCHLFTGLLLNVTIQTMPISAYRNNRQETKRKFKSNNKIIFIVQSVHTHNRTLWLALAQAKEETAPYIRMSTVWWCPQTIVHPQIPSILSFRQFPSMWFFQNPNYVQIKVEIVIAMAHFECYSVLYRISCCTFRFPGLWDTNWELLEIFKWNFFVVSLLLRSFFLIRLFAFHRPFSSSFIRVWWFAG